MKRHADQQRAPGKLRHFERSGSDTFFHAQSNSHAGTADHDAAHDEHDAVHDGRRRADLFWLDSITEPAEEAEQDVAKAISAKGHVCFAS